MEFENIFTTSLPPAWTCSWRRTAPTPPPMTRTSLSGPRRLARPWTVGHMPTFPIYFRTTYWPTPISLPQKDRLRKPKRQRTRWNSPTLWLYFFTSFSYSFHSFFCYYHFFTPWLFGIHSLPYHWHPVCACAVCRTCVIFFSPRLSHYFFCVTYDFIFLQVFLTLSIHYISSIF